PPARPLPYERGRRCEPRSPRRHRRMRRLARRRRRRRRVGGGVRHDRRKEPDVLGLGLVSSTRAVAVAAANPRAPAGGPMSGPMSGPMTKETSRTAARTPAPPTSKRARWWAVLALALSL